MQLGGLFRPSSHAPRKAHQCRSQRLPLRAEQRIAVPLRTLAEPAITFGRGDGGRGTGNGDGAGGGGTHTEHDL